MVLFRSLTLLLLLSATACGPIIRPAANSVAPLPQQYTCDDTTALAGELKALPPDSVLMRMMTDYHTERQKLAAAAESDPKKAAALLKCKS